MNCELVVKNLIKVITYVQFQRRVFFEMFTVKKIGHGLEHVKTNLRFFGLSLNFYSNF